MEGLPAPGYTGSDVYPYLKHHDPFSYFTDVLDSSAQAANIVPFTQLALDLSSGTAPAFAFIVPNVENDAHDCPGGGMGFDDSAKLAAADSCLSYIIAPLLHSPALSTLVVFIICDYI